MLRSASQLRSTPTIARAATHIRPPPQRWVHHINQSTLASLSSSINHTRISSLLVRTLRTSSRHFQSEEKKADQPNSTSSDPSANDQTITIDVEGVDESKDIDNAPELADDFNPLDDDPSAEEFTFTEDELNAAIAARYGVEVEGLEAPEPEKLTRSERRHAARKLGEPSAAEIKEIQEADRMAVASMEMDMEQDEDEDMEDEVADVDGNESENKDKKAEGEYAIEVQDEYEDGFEPLELESAAGDPLTDPSLEDDAELVLDPDATEESVEKFQKFQAWEAEVDSDPVERLMDDIAAEKAEIQREAKFEADYKAREEKLAYLKHKKLTDPLTSFFSSLKMQDHAEKFESIDDILKLKTRDLKEMGLNVKQRKTYLKLVDRYKAQMRANAALSYIRKYGYTLTPAQLQEGVYKIVYGHVYESNAVREENAKITREWRAPIEEHRLKHSEEHNEFRGLREAELMEMAKLEAVQVASAREYIKSQLPSPEELAAIHQRREELAERFERRFEGQREAIEEEDEGDEGLVEAK